MHRSKVGRNVRPPSVAEQGGCPHAEGEKQRRKDSYELSPRTKAEKTKRKSSSRGIRALFVTEVGKRGEKQYVSPERWLMCIVLSSVVHRDLVPITCHHRENEFGIEDRFLSLEVDRAAGTVGGMDPLRRWALQGLRKGWSGVSD